MNRNIKPYTTKTGLQQFMPSTDLLAEMDYYGQGFCLACGVVEYNIDPDAVRDTCSCCGSAKVYGAAELALRGLCFVKE